MGKKIGLVRALDTDPAPLTAPPAWKNSDIVGFEGALLTVVFTNEPGWPSASAVVYVGPFESPRSW